MPLVNVVCCSLNLLAKNSYLMLCCSSYRWFSLAELSPLSLARYNFVLHIGTQCEPCKMPLTIMLLVEHCSQFWIRKLLFTILDHAPVSCGLYVSWQSVLCNPWPLSTLTFLGLTVSSVLCMLYDSCTRHTLNLNKLVRNTGASTASFRKQWQITVCYCCQVNPRQLSKAWHYCIIL